MTGLAVASAPARTLVITAAVLAVGVSFALVAGAMSLLRAPTSTTQSVLLDADPPAALSSQPPADARAGTPGAATALDTTVSGASGSPVVGSELSRAQAIALVQGRYRARVVRTTLSQDKGGRRLYVFRLLSGSGKVWTVRIDAQTGAEVP